VVAEGRDIGSVVLPDAEVKIFLTASPLERARRRQAELRTQGVERTVEDVLVEQNARDERDTTRATAPLRAADDATIVDTDRLTLEQVVARILEVVAERFDTHSGTM
jgi:cytidylate kinase